MATSLPLKSIRQLFLCVTTHGEAHKRAGYRGFMLSRFSSWYKDPMVSSQILTRLYAMLDGETPDVQRVLSECPLRTL